MCSKRSRVLDLIFQALKIFKHHSPLPFFILIMFLTVNSWAGTGGGVSGTLRDSSGAVISGATVTVTNTDLNIKQKVTTDHRGFYSSAV